MARTMQNEEAAKKKAKAIKKSIRKYMEKKKSQYKEQGMTKLDYCTTSTEFT